MAEYRIFAIGAGGHFVGVEAGRFDNDDEAMQHAAAQSGRLGATEVWCGARLVGRVSGADYPVPDATASAGAISAVSGRTRASHEGLRLLAPSPFRPARTVQIL